MATPSDLTLPSAETPDDDMDGCRRLAWDLYGAEHVLSHEQVARELGDFLRARLGEQESTPERGALLSVAFSAQRTATYLSCGRKAITIALATLLRLALAYEAHADYRDEWRP